MPIKKLEQNDLDKVSGGETYEIKEINNGWGNDPSYAIVKSDTLGLFSSKEEAKSAIAERKEENRRIRNYLTFGPDVDDF